MPRKALPQNYLVAPGTTMNFDVLSGWSAYQATMQLNTNEFKTGSASVKVSVNPGMAFGLITKTITLDLSKSDMVEFNVYFDTEPSTVLTSFFLYLSSKADLSTNFFKSFSPGGALHKGWNRIRISKNEWTNNGGESWSNQMVALRMRLDPVSGQSASASLNNLIYGIQAIPKVLIQFDDADNSVYSQALPYMDSKGLKGTIYAIKNYTGTSVYMDIAKLTTFYQKGWAIGNHTTTHNDLISWATQSEIENELLTTTNWLDSLGFTRASRHVAYPRGKYDDRVLATMSKLGMKSGRTTLEIKQATPVDDYRLLTINQIFNTTTLADAKKMVDNAISAKGTAIILFHEIVQTPSTQTQWAISDFKALIDYIAAKNVSAVTIDEWYEGLTNPRYRSQPLDRQVV